MLSSQDVESWARESTIRLVAELLGVSDVDEGLACNSDGPINSASKNIVVNVMLPFPLINCLPAQASL